MTPADLARRLFRDQCRPNDLSAYGETAAVAALVPLIEALESAAGEFDLILQRLRDGQEGRAAGAAICGAKDARAALTPQPEEVAEEHDDRPEWEMRTGFREEDFA